MRHLYCVDRKKKFMENVSTKLSFPQRNWFLLCIIVAILSPLLVHWLHVGAQKVTYMQAIDPKVKGSSSKDSSYKIPNSPTTAPAGNKNATDSSGH